MKIGPVDNGNGPVRPEEDQKRNQDVAKEKPARSSREDSVTISESGKRLSEQSRSSVRPAKSDEIDQSNDNLNIKDEEEVRTEKVEQARKRMESGHYDNPKVRREIARRITDDFIG
jgi:anti-sigma28 factor (negative regulator of flagellin synthesis)